MVRRSLSPLTKAGAAGADSEEAEIRVSVTGRFGSEAATNIR